jgi:hypothetical protein
MKQKKMLMLAREYAYLQHDWQDNSSNSRVVVSKSSQW